MPKKHRDVRITPQPPPDEEVAKISFSFVHVTDDDRDFSVSHAKKKGYVIKLINRLKHFSGLEKRHLINSRDKHTHRIDWKKTSKSGFGFKGANKQYEGYEPWQISIEEGTKAHPGHGRIQGFFIGNVFYVRWFDPNHRLYQ